MSTTLDPARPTRPVPAGDPADAGRPAGPDVARLSAWSGVAFTVCQLSVMVAMAVFVLPKGGGPSTPALERGTNVLDVADLYRYGNYAFAAAGMLLIGFLGVVHLRLQRADETGVLAGVALAAGTLLALVWPFAAVLHDVAIDTAEAGADVRILGAWDSVAPYALAFSAFPRAFFVLALVLGLRLAGDSRWLQRTGLAIVAVSLLGTATLLSGALFPALALSTLAYEIWVGALAWHWLRDRRSPASASAPAPASAPTSASSSAA
jgi:hypothetical protein